MAKQEIVKQEAAPLAEADELSALLGQYAGAGTENVTNDDIILPRLLLLQPTSPLSSEEPFRAGYLANSVSKTSFGNKASFYIVHFYTSRVNWANDEIGGPIDCSSQDGLTGTQEDNLHGGGMCGRCPMNAWTKEMGQNMPPHCTEFKNLIVVPANDPESVPMLFSAKRTGMNAVRELLSAVKYSHLPIFAHQYTIASEKTENAKGTWFVPRITIGEKVSSVLVLQGLINLHKAMKEAQDRILTPTDDLEGSAGPGVGDESAF